MKIKFNGRFKKVVLFVAFLAATVFVRAQTRVQVQRDTVVISNGELKINNSTKNVQGYLYNTGNGVTTFKTPDRFLDTLWSGHDTLYYTKSGVPGYTKIAGSGNPTMVLGNAISGATKGSILYAGTNGVLQQSNGVFYFDSTQQRLGIGTNAPAAKLHSLATTEQLRLGYDANNYTTFTTSSGGTLVVDNVASSGAPFTQFNDIVYFSLGQRTGTSLTNGNFTSGGMGMLSTTDANWLFGGASTIYYRAGGRGASNTALTSNSAHGSWVIARNPLTTASSGTHPIVANLAVLPLVITAGGATVTNTASVYVEDAPTGGTNNWALLVNNGASKFGGDIKLGNAGNGIYIKEGTNAVMGVATLANGTITVNTTKVTASSRIFLTINGGNLNNVGTTYISSRTAGASFTISSTNSQDASNVAWLIVEPN